MSDKKYRERFPPPPDEAHPSLRFARYIVDWVPMSVASYSSADDMTPETTNCVVTYSLIGD